MLLCVVSSEPRRQQQPQTSPSSEQREQTARTTADGSNEASSPPATVTKAERHVLASKPPRANGQQAPPAPGNRHALQIIQVEFIFIPFFFPTSVSAPPAENPRPGREGAPPPATEDKRQPAVSAPTYSSAKQAVGNPAPSRPPAARTEAEENDYDSDDASKAALGASASHMCWS